MRHFDEIPDVPFKPSIEMKDGMKDLVCTCYSIEFIISYIQPFGCITNYSIFHSTGRKIAIDASMSIYQFLIAVRSDGSQLTNEQGETTR